MASHSSFLSHYIMYCPSCQCCQVNASLMRGRGRGLTRGSGHSRPETQYRWKIASRGLTIQRDGALGCSAPKQKKTWRLWELLPPLSPPLFAYVSGCFTKYHAKGITTTCSLAYSFCDGPSGAQDMPLLLADPISLTSLVNLDGKKSRLCHLSVIA